MPIYFALLTAPDTLVTLTIICDILSVIGSYFAVSMTFINILAIASAIIQVLMISDTLLSPQRRLSLNSPPSMSLRPQKQAETFQFLLDTSPTSDHASSTSYTPMPA